jgi:hypothetical protein
MTIPASDSPAVSFVPITRLVQQEVQFLWPGRLALGKLAILDGDPGLGKSLVTLDLCARVTTGRPFPDNSPGAEPGNVLVLNGEDGAEDTIRPRLHALGADQERVFIPHQEATGTAPPLYLPKQLDTLDQALTQTRARLVVIDPIMAFLDSSIFSASDQSVRRCLYPLAVLAGRHHCAILLVRHLSKWSGRQPLYRGGGSIGIVGACRSAWLIARDPDEPERRVLAQVKNNLAPFQPSLAYTLGSKTNGPVQFSWLGPSPRTAEQLLEAPPAASTRGQLREEAGDALESFLLEAVHTSQEVWAFAHRQGISERTLRRAKEELSIRSVRVWAEGKRLSYWLLPGQELPPEVAAAAAASDLEAWLAPLRAKYPPSVPLEDL